MTWWRTRAATFWLPRQKVNLPVVIVPWRTSKFWFHLPKSVIILRGLMQSWTSWRGREVARLGVGIEQLQPIFLFSICAPRSHDAFCWLQVLITKSVKLQPKRIICFDWLEIKLRNFRPCLCNYNQNMDTLYENFLAHFRTCCLTTLAVFSFIYDVASWKTIFNLL